ncbi:acetyltransferase [Vibrio inusitatus NBRC 102082]|uniref:Acetyltransferase n=1 Tax=Vibrio inusitatus NBRC 102082 TaxID=1219070 RepID=A0A4Y3I072_9VIBR|nr:DHH family phosphoesterase [Vibrio inusitatus]GEA52823.1 acetyltransferase [Vibrio inusitatus NBRC 102082]
MSKQPTHYDVFNGDADGICSLLQLRLNTPKNSTLITGVKRDIQLIQQVDEQQDVTSATVLDISMKTNQSALQSLLDREVDVFYCDHHRTGNVPISPYLKSLLDASSDVCTSLLINLYLNNYYYLWACVGAFGDNLSEQATDLALEHSVASEDIDFLKQLGTLINYNAYGSSIEDLHFHPKALFESLLKYPNPLLLRNKNNGVFDQLKAGFDNDWSHVKSIPATYSSQNIEVYQLPNEAWARRISGTYGNWLANEHPNKAFAVLTANSSDESYTVSVRSPLTNREGADDVCSQFATGGGRKAAAGINALPEKMIDLFIEKMEEQFGY